MSAAGQPSLFDAEASVDHQQAASARMRMRAMIERLQAASVPYWRDDTAAILEAGVFQRAMRLVPPQEAQVLWADFEKEVQRLYAVWDASETSGS